MVMHPRGVDNALQEVHYLNEPKRFNLDKGVTMSVSQTNLQYKLRFLDDVDHQKLKEIAKKKHLPMNWLINQAIKNFLKESAKA